MSDQERSERIDQIIDQLRERWHQLPNLRLCELISILARDHCNKMMLTLDGDHRYFADVYDVEDDVIEKELERHLRLYKDRLAKVAATTPTQTP
jgi:uncharacterized protein YihD (DUF1040 family)